MQNPCELFCVQGWEGTVIQTPGAGGRSAGLSDSYTHLQSSFFLFSPMGTPFSKYQSPLIPGAPQHEAVFFLFLEAGLVLAFSLTASKILLPTC